MIVDDSAYVRHIVSKHLSEAPGLTVVGVARDGEEALHLLPQLQPDVLTLDVEMPRRDGLTTLREIMTHSPLPVVMLSSLTASGAEATLQALALGAVDFVTKPEARANVGAVMEEVIAKIRVAARAHIYPLSPGTSQLVAGTHSASKRPLAPRPALARTAGKVVVIGASTGGPRALSTVISQLPEDLPAALLIVQHMPAGFTLSLADRLNEISALSIKHAAAGDRLLTGHGLLAPGGFHMVLDDDHHIALNRAPTQHGVRPAVDVTMQAIAERYRGDTIGVVLTGMGSDGTRGARRINQVGGHVIAEDESSCVVWGMPRSVAEAGVADEILPLPQIAPAIVRAVQGA
jgi:two-component system chemotaxis response regulator CheB